MKPGGPIIMRQFSVLTDAPSELVGCVHALLVRWCEDRGGSAILMLENWNELAPNIWRVTLPRN